MTNPEAGQPLNDLLVDLLDHQTEVCEATDPLLGVDLALIVTEGDRVLVAAKADLDRAQAIELLEQAMRTDATCLVLPNRSPDVRAALRVQLTAAARYP